MLTYTIRRLLISIPTLLLISLVIFLLLDMAPGDPMAQVPLTVPPEVKEKMREALGLGEPVYIRFWKWLIQFFVIEPGHLIDSMFGTALAEGQQRVISWQTRSPVMDIVAQRMPQTLWVVGLSYVIGTLIALPIGIVSAYRQYSIIDQIGTFISMIGFSVPTFFTGVLLIVIFSVQLGWFPSIYDTTHVVNDWPSFVFQVKQMAMPVFVLALYNAAQISRFMRASMLDNLNQDYVRTARAKGLTEKVVVLVHVLRNSMIPVVTVIA
ncbi:MAG: ABC transporter permease, partial [Tranquillimonas sp.]